jgi:hypothetical protein
MKIQDIVLLVFVAFGSAVIGFFAGQIERKKDVLKCTVIRVVESEEDEPTAKGSPKVPYTIVQYSPQWEVFVMPGKLGEEGQIVHLDPVMVR